MLSNIKIGKRLAIGFSAVLAFLLASSFFSSHYINKVSQETGKLYRHPYSVSVALLSIDADVARMHRSMKDVALSKSSEDIDKASRDVDENETDVLAKFKVVQERFLGDKTDIDETYKLFMDWKPIRDRVIALTRQGDRDEAAKITREQGARQVGAIFKKLEGMIAFSSKRAVAFVENADAIAQDSMAVAWAFAGGSILLGIVAAWLVTRSITVPVKSALAFAVKVAGGSLNETLEVRRKDEIGVLADSLRDMVVSLKATIERANVSAKTAQEESDKAKAATLLAEKARLMAESAKAEGMLAAAGKIDGVVERVTSASEELSAQVTQSSRGAEQQSRRVGETATAMEEMNATVMAVAKNASQAAEAADAARRKAQDGAGIVERVVKGIGDVQVQALELKQDMSSLGEQAESIGRIMGVISDIADQTNLLALNAAIEAARAGDAGRGFAVVADEVRKLAEKTMHATKEVGQAIGGIQQGARRNVDNVERAVRMIEEATSLANQSGDALGEIVSLVDDATDQARSIATASEQQSAASEEINRSIEEVSAISSETAQAMAEAAQAVSDLANQALALRGLIGEMQSGETRTPKRGV